MVLVHGDIIGESDIAVSILHPYEEARGSRSRLASEDPGEMSNIAKETSAVRIRAAKRWR